MEPDPKPHDKDHESFEKNLDDVIDSFFSIKARIKDTIDPYLS
jgi:hypothetical protein